MKSIPKKSYFAKELALKTLFGDQAFADLRKLMDPCCGIGIDKICIAPCGGGGGGGAFTSITGIPTEVAYFGPTGNGTSDSQFTRIEATHDTSILRTPIPVTGVMGFETLETLEPESTLYGLPVTGSHMFWKDLVTTGFIGTIYAIANPNDGTPYLGMVAMDTVTSNGGNISMFKNNGDTWKANMTTNNDSVLGQMSFITSESSDTLSRNEIETSDNNTGEKSTFQTLIGSASISHRNPGLDFNSFITANDNGIFMQAATISTANATTFQLDQTATTFGDTNGNFGGNFFQMIHGTVVQYGDLNLTNSYIYRSTNTGLGYDVVNGLKNLNYTGVSFTGIGANDMTASVFYTVNAPSTYDIQIDGVETYQWMINGIIQAQNIPILAGVSVALDSVVTITFMTSTGHVLNDVWSLSFNPSFGTAQTFDFNNARVTTGDVNGIYTHTKQFIDAGAGNFIQEMLGSGGQYFVSNTSNDPFLSINEATNVMWLGMGNGFGNGTGVKVTDNAGIVNVGDIFGNGTNMGVDKLNDTISFKSHGGITTYAQDIPITVKVNVSSAELLNLVASPKILVPAPAAGQAIHVLSVSYKFIYGTAGYTGVSNIVTAIAGVPIFTLGTFYTYISDRYGHASSSPTNSSSTSFEAEPLTLFNFTAVDIAAGDGTVTVYITYKLIDL